MAYRPDRRHLVLGAAALGLSACAGRRGGPPDIARSDHVLIAKAERRLYLLRGPEVVRSYHVGLGFAPEGHKLAEGDGRTPEGLYWIDRKNPRSSFHLSLGISYPSAADAARAEALGLDPGRDIFIHGRPGTGPDPDDPDWTAGCIAVSNREIAEIYHSVPMGTPVTIRA